MTAEDKINILVVDDLPDKLLALETVLESLGENVVTARSGREALRRLLERDYAVILLDVKMPDMDGFETASLIRQRKKTEHTPIIFVTALSDETHLNQGYSLGAVDYILSPVSPEVLRTKVGVFVDLYRMTEQVRRQAEERVALAQRAGGAGRGGGGGPAAAIPGGGRRRPRTLVGRDGHPSRPGETGRAVYGGLRRRRPRRTGRRLAHGNGRRPGSRRLARRGRGTEPPRALGGQVDPGGRRPRLPGGPAQGARPNHRGAGAGESWPALCGRGRDAGRRPGRPRRRRPGERPAVPRPGRAGPP